MSNKNVTSLTGQEPSLDDPVLEIDSLDAPVFDLCRYLYEEEVPDKANMTRAIDEALESVIMLVYALSGTDEHFVDRPADRVVYPRGGPPEPRGGCAKGLGKAIGNPLILHRHVRGRFQAR